MKLWVDDIRPAPDKGVFWLTAKSVRDAKRICCEYLVNGYFINLDEISLDHDAGYYQSDGGDYIKLLDWLEKQEKQFGWVIPPISIHTGNPVGRENMMRIIRKNDWIFR